MNIATFSNIFALALRKDRCGEQIVPGSYGHIYEYSQEELGVIFCPNDDAREWANVRRSCLKVGMVLRQNGDSEVALSFDPKNPDQAYVAIRVSGIPLNREQCSKTPHFGVGFRGPSALGRTAEPSMGVYP